MGGQSVYSLTGEQPESSCMAFRCGKWIINPRSKTRTSVTSGKELSYIRQHTKVLQDYSELEELTQYPEPVQKLLKKFARIQADKLVKMIL